MKAIINFRIITIIHGWWEPPRATSLRLYNKCTPDIDTFYKRFPLKRSLPRHPCQSPNNLRQFTKRFLLRSKKKLAELLIIKKTLVDLNDSYEKIFQKKEESFSIMRID